MEEISNQYKQLNILGEGAYGIVWKALELNKNRIVAVKKIKVNTEEEGISCSTLR